jgi:uncharacterized protein with PIN domain
MSTAHFRFHGRLNDFLPHDQQNEMIIVSFRGRQSIKHLAESLGSPHPEIGRVRVNGREGGVNDITQDGDGVELFPIENGRSIEPRFLLDCHLGRLAAYLRMLGFDCLYQDNFEDQTMTDIAVREGRILLTRDRRLLMRKIIEQGYCLRSLNSFEQLREVVERFELMDLIQPFHRCIRCNHPLEPVEKEEVIDQLEPLTKKYFNEFHICPACKQIYWKGSHFDRMQKFIEKVSKMEKRK